MTLEPNTLISHYRILSPIGKGGMGEVYCAIDERLGREVAIKLLPEDFSRDKDRLARFEQEAKATSALNHPNILTVYDIGEHDGSPFLVAELLDGEELRDRLESGPIPEKKAVEYARQIASGLSAAHGKGIVHRDLKPENIFITADERVKILDFGIAKLTEKEPVQSEDATRKALTDPGMVLGTAGYMSPEQVRGEHVDHRSDIFSFGSILHEILTGKRLFQRETMPETMAAILKDEPEELAEANPNINPAIQGIVERCLEKKPERRFQSTNDLEFALENLSVSSGVSRQHARSEAAPSVSGRSLKTIGVSAASVVAGLLIAAGFWYFFANSGDPHRGLVMSVVPPEGKLLPRLASLSSVLSVSPDGRSLLFDTVQDGLFIRHFNSSEPVKVPGSERAGNQPVWRDSSTVTFHSSLRGWTSIRMPDGAPETVVEGSRWTRGGSWSSSGRFIYSTGETLVTTGPDRKPIEIKNPTGRNGKLLHPDFIGDSEDFLVLFIPDDYSDREIWMATLSGNEMTDVTVLFKNETQANYTPYSGGKVLFVRDDNLYAQDIDLSSRSMTGEPKLIVQKVASQNAGEDSRADFSVSDNGVVAWRSGQTSSSQITAFSRTGEVLSTAGPAGSYSNILVSPADDSLLLAEPENGPDGLVETGQGGISDLPTGVYWFGWTTDGTSVVGVRDRKVIARNVNGGAENVIGSSPPNAQWPKAISPDGTLLLHFCEDVGPICVSRLGQDGAFGNTQPLVNSDEFHPVSSFSPDGKYIVYRVSGNSASGGIYVQRYPGSGRRTLLTQDTGTPVWRRDGKEIVYANDGAIWSVQVSGSGENLSFAEPVKLFSGLRYPSNMIQQSVYMQVSSDGSRIYWVQAAEESDDNVINVMFGF